MGMVWGAAPSAVVIDTVTADGVTAGVVITTRAVWLSALVLRVPSADTAVTANIRSGSPDAGNLLFAVTVPAGQTFAWSLAHPGLPAPAGVSVQVTAGSADISVTTVEAITA